MIISLRRSISCIPHIEDDRQFPAPCCVAESHFRGRISCCRGIVFRVLFLNGTVLYMAYFFLSVVAGLMETLCSEPIRRLKTGGVNGEKTSNKVQIIVDIALRYV